MQDISVLKSPLSNFMNKIIEMDCLEGMKQLPDESVDLVLTDPPYGISKEGAGLNVSKMRLKAYRKRKNLSFDFGNWDKFESIEEFDAFMEAWFKEAVRVLKPYGWIFIFMRKEKFGLFENLFQKYGVVHKNIFVWIKSNPLFHLRRINFRSGVEMILCGSKGNRRMKNYLRQSEMKNYFVTSVKSGYGVTEHPTEKPVELLKRLIEPTTLPGDVVLDCFMGSGSTAVAAYTLGRNFIGFEKDAEYCKMANSRLTRLNCGEKKVEDYGT